MEQRKNIIPVSRKPKTRRDHVTYHVTHVIDDTADGGKSGYVVHEKTIKSPVLPYNKWEPTISVMTLPISGAGGGRSSGPGDNIPIRAHNPFGYATLDETPNAVQKNVTAASATILDGGVETEVALFLVFLAYK